MVPLPVLTVTRYVRLYAPVRIQITALRVLAASDHGVDWLRVGAKLFAAMYTKRPTLTTADTPLAFRVVSRSPPPSLTGMNLRCCLSYTRNAGAWLLVGRALLR